ncbi:unnamed protein product [Dibothriocephalus latus]|uniref:Endoplasmic reticulum lectin 1 n=1 Tax=Dibothriocephalus latus TaxID=60516 RepID=A0A3P6Q9H5_DIBLA|nr:unnamed protein product [Dibothriocephalus latus]
MVVCTHISGSAICIIFSSLFTFTWPNAEAFDLNDDVFYHIRWKEEEISPREDSPYVLVNTIHNESFSCSLPTAIKGKDYQAYVESDKNGSMLLKEMFTAVPCTYKVYGYWTYELCHDKHIRQYRAEVISPESTRIVKEFYLGYKQAPETDADMGSFEVCSS